MIFINEKKIIDLQNNFHNIIENYCFNFKHTS